MSDSGSNEASTEDDDWRRVIEWDSSNYEPTWLLEHEESREEKIKRADR